MATSGEVYCNTCDTNLDSFEESIANFDLIPLESDFNKESNLCE